MRRVAPIVLQYAALVGFAVSAWLVAQYQLAPDQMLCGTHGGCQTVRACEISGHGLLTWPTLGVVAYGALLALSLSGRERLRALLPFAGVLAGVTGITLIVLQHVVCHALCEWCIVTDATGILVALAALWARGVPYTPVRRDRLALGGLAVLAAVSAASWGLSKPKEHAPTQNAQLPEPIAREQRPGVATIVEFADFECPYCRRQHDDMKAVVDSYGDRVRFVRKHVPLTFHQHAADAARAACCAEEQGHGDDMANALFHSEDLSPAGCERIASGLGVDVGPYRECLTAPRTQARLDHDHNDAAESHIEGLPTTFVGREKFLGVVSAQTLRASIDRALRQTPPSGGPRT